MAPSGAAWVLRGVTSHLRYTTDAERATLVARQPALARCGIGSCGVPRRSLADYVIGTGAPREVTATGGG